jgi:MoaA/NifB/PqqE/SkfB family radical SAM enzyme
MNLNDFCLFTIPKKWKKIVWEITSKCNMSCLHCCTNALSKPNFNELVCSDGKLIRKRLTEMLSFGIKEFYVSGGEPLLVKNIFDITNFLKRKRAMVSLATNGYCLDENTIKKFSQIGINLLHISLDGHLPEIHNTLRGGNFFDRIVKNLAIVKKYKIPLRIGCIIWRKNENFLEEMVKLCLDLGVKELRFSWLIKVGRFKQNPKIYPKRQWLSVMREIKKLKKKYKNKILISIHRNPFVKIKTNYLCPAGEKIFFLNPKGRLSPCSWIAKIDSKFVTEDSLAEKTFGELIKSKQISEFKKLLKERNKKNFKGCPFISKYKFHSYFSNDNCKL